MPINWATRLRRRLSARNIPSRLNQYARELESHRLRSFSRAGNAALMIFAYGCHRLRFSKLETILTAECAVRSQFEATANRLRALRLGHIPPWRTGAGLPR